MKENPNDKIWAVSMAPKSLQTPVHVRRKLKGTAAWRIHMMKEIGDPAADPYPAKAPLGAPTKAERAKILQLEKERDELQAKFDALAAQLQEKEGKSAKVKESEQTANA